MTQPALEFFKTKGLAIKIETVSGTDSTPTALLDGMMIMDGSSGTEFDKIERNLDRPFFTNNPFAVGNKRAFVEGMMDLYPPLTPGTTVPHVDTVLQIGGMTSVLSTKKTTYNPISAAIKSATVYWWHVDAQKKILGARANVSSVSFVVGEIPKIQIRIEGSYTNVTKEAVPAITLPIYVPKAVNAENTTTTFSCADATLTDLLVWGKELSIDFGTTLSTKEYTSLRLSGISGRLATWKLRIARADLAEFNPWTIRDNASIVSAKIKQILPGSLLSSSLQIRGQIEQVSEVDIDGDLGWELSGPCIASNTGGDEFIIEFEDTNP